jgi:hypothetical protein
MSWSASICDYLHPRYLLIPLQQRKEVRCNIVEVVTITTSVKFEVLTYIEFLEIIWHASHDLKWNINTIRSAWKQPTRYYNIRPQRTVFEDRTVSGSDMGTQISNLCHHNRGWWKFSSSWEVNETLSQARSQTTNIEVAAASSVGAHTHTYTCI